MDGVVSLQQKTKVISRTDRSIFLSPQINLHFQIAYLLLWIDVIVREKRDVKPGPAEKVGINSCIGSQIYNVHP